jgi:serine/threonine-protein kinase PknG
VPSDLFTVARTLAVLCFDFHDYQSDHRFTLPSQDTIALLQRYDSLYRFLLKATSPEPGDRFQSAAEMADQLFGVLVEVVADREGVPVEAPSKLFTTAMSAGLERPDWHVLPRPQVSRDDPGAGYLAMLDAGWLADAGALLAEIEAGAPRDWRVRWYRGIAEMAGGSVERAIASFDDVYTALPGEIAPKLALGLAHETAGALTAAARWYGIVAQTNPAITSASFGLARCHLDGGDRAGALLAYERVPDTSSGYIDAQIARIRCLSAGEGDRDPALDDLIAAGSALEALPLDGVQRERLTADLLDATLRITQAAEPVDADRVRLLGVPLVERELRIALEHSYRELARHAANLAERIALVDDANRVRPRTWI